VYYPQGSDAANAQYSLVIHVDGARGHAYVDRTTKTIHVTIWKRETIVLDREYRTTAGDLKWKVFWSALDDIRIVFFEYGKPVPKKEPPDDFSKAANQIFALAFTFDQMAKLFAEAPVPVAVVEQIAQDAAKENRRRTVDIHFDDSAENETRILNAVTDLAAKHGLQSRTPLVGEIGRLAEWSAVDLSLDVQRYDSLRQVAVEIDDYTGHDLATELAAKLHALPGFAGTRRTASVDFRARSQDPEATIQIVESIAMNHGLSRLDRKTMFTIARFGTAGLQVTVDYFESDGTMKVLIEDSSWHTEFVEIEHGLRAALLKR
jgi:hypothetical protein